MSLETSNAMQAVRVVRDAGGSITFDAYDAAMGPIPIWTPINWTCGWGLYGKDRKANLDKMCVFVACRMGLLRQTETGYEVVEANQ